MATNGLRAALRTLGVDIYSNFTLHSFRRGAAEAYDAAGLSLETIKQLGHWKSDSVLPYLKRKPVSVPPRALKIYFG